MTGSAVYTNMGTFQGEIGTVVIETFLPVPSRMAAKAGMAFPYISANPAMFFIHILLSVTGDTCERCEISRVLMAIGAGVPFTIMLAAVYREVLPVMILELCRLPAEVEGMAEITLQGETRKRMVGIDGGIIFICMAGIAVTWCFAV